ncbi:OmpA family protein [Brumimicrobium mesophilum]|uniref:OmpA family protein n=1 Tax=Brumimicrobium mesophilum TaxID=392717 RepID=UPI000D1441E5|nr:OmpA family protein [Brumimicrobium mesophilum]
MNIFKSIAVSSLFGIFILSSCAPIYKCGDPIPEKKPSGKRIQAVISERDSLCTDLAQEKQTTSNLRADKVVLEKKLSTQQTINYDQADQFGKALQEKSEALEEQEKLLKDREATLRELQDIIARKDAVTKKLNDVLRNALLGFNSDELSIDIIDGKVYVSLSDKLLFRSGSAAVETKGTEALKVLAEVLIKNPDIDILVEGHTDNVPIKTAIYKDNWDLSVARATAITRILTETNGVNAKRVVASGRSEFYPKATNETAEGRAKNRRTEIILSPKLDEMFELLKGN